LVEFGLFAYPRRSANSRLLLTQLTELYRAECFDMSYTMDDFKRDFVKENFPKLAPADRREVLESLPPEERLAGLSVEQIRAYLDRLRAGRLTQAATKKVIGGHCRDTANGSGGISRRTQGCPVAPLFG
jgi:hypothetical protein